MGKPQQVLHSTLALGPQKALWEQAKASVLRRGVSPTAIPLYVCPLQMCCSGASPSAAFSDSFHPSAANRALSLFCSHRSGEEDNIPHKGCHQPSASTILGISIPSMTTSCPFTAQQWDLGTHLHRFLSVSLHPQQPTSLIASFSVRTANSLPQPAPGQGRAPEAHWCCRWHPLAHQLPRPSWGTPSWVLCGPQAARPQHPLWWSPFRN